MGNGDGCRSRRWRRPWRRSRSCRTRCPWCWGCDSSRAALARTRGSAVDDELGQGRRRNSTGRSPYRAGAERRVYVSRDLSDARNFRRSRIGNQSGRREGGGHGAGAFGGSIYLVLARRRRWRRRRWRRRPGIPRSADGLHRVHPPDLSRCRLLQDAQGRIREESARHEAAGSRMRFDSITPSSARSYSGRFIPRGSRS